MIEQMATVYHRGARATQQVWVPCDRSRGLIRNASVRLNSLRMALKQRKIGHHACRNFVASAAATIYIWGSSAPARSGIVCWESYRCAETRQDGVTDNLRSGRNRRRSRRIPSTHFKSSNRSPPILRRVARPGCRRQKLCLRIRSGKNGLRRSCGRRQHRDAYSRAGA
jgi:hypothetical protein